jgi:hypothetical protein
VPANQTDALISEAQFQEALVEYAELWGWLVWHDNDSRRNDAGFPDLVTISTKQLEWIEALSQASGPNVMAAIWFPSDRDYAEAVLRGEKWGDDTTDVPG